MAIAGTVAIVLFVVVSVIMIREAIAYRERMVRELVILADVVAANTAWSLERGDLRAPQTYLSALHADERILEAHIYRPDGRVIASRGGVVDHVHGPPPMEELTRRSVWSSPATLEDHIDVYRRIVIRGEPVGVVHLVGDLRPLAANLKQHLITGVLIFLAALLLALALSTALARLIAEPMLTLVGFMQRVAATGDYSLRLEPPDEGEVGQVFRGFNALLERLAEHEESRRAYSRELSEEVARRTEELARARDAAMSADRAKTTFLANMSHEIRTPLNAVLGFSQVLADDPRVRERYGRELRAIQAGGRQLLALINDLLDLSRIEAGAVEIHRRTFDLHEVLQTVLSLFEGRCEEDGTDLTLDAPLDGAELVAGDPDRLRQILANLVANAVKFARGGRVRVTVARQGENVEFQVSDDGPGVSTEDEATLFGTFRQGAEGREKGGTGLGLAISRQLARLMGGDVRLGPSAPDLGGATFVLTVPLPKAEPAGESGGAPPDVGLRPRRLMEGCTALVVDDVQDNCEVLAALLKRLGCDVVTLRSGQEAVERAAREAFDLILVDLIMPGMDGFATLEALRELPQEDRPVVIAVTAGASRAGQEAARQAGFDGYLAKPILFDALVAELAPHFITDESLDRVEHVPPPARPPAADLVHRLARSRPDLLDRLERGLELYQVTDLEDLAATIEGEVPEATDVARQMRAYLDRVDLAGLARWFEKHRREGAS